MNRAVTCLLLLLVVGCTTDGELDDVVVSEQPADAPSTDPVNGTSVAPAPTATPELLVDVDSGWTTFVADDQPGISWGAALTNLSADQQLDGVVITVTATSSDGTTWTDMTAVDALPAAATINVGDTALLQDLSDIDDVTVEVADGTFAASAAAPPAPVGATLAPNPNGGWDIGITDVPDGQAVATAVLFNADNTIVGGLTGTVTANDPTLSTPFPAAPDGTYATVTVTR